MYLKSGNLLPTTHRNFTTAFECPSIHDKMTNFFLPTIFIASVLCMVYLQRTSTDLAMQHHEAEPCKIIGVDQQHSASVTNSSGSNQSDHPMVSFNQQWNELKQHMCPNMQPNRRVWLTLFELARSELGLTNHRLVCPKSKENIWMSTWSYIAHKGRWKVYSAFFQVE